MTFLVFIVILALTNAALFRDMRTAQFSDEKLEEIVKEMAEDIKEISELRQQNIEQSQEITELKKELKEFRRINEEQNSRLTNLEEVIMKIGPGIGNFEKSTTESSTNISTPMNQMSSSMTVPHTTMNTFTTPETQTAANRTLELEEKCQLDLNGTCYWVKFHEDRFYYNGSMEACEKYNGSLALIPNEETYNSLVELARQKMPDRWHGANMWTGIQFDTETGEVSPSDTYTKWDVGFPYKIDGWTVVFLDFAKNPTSTRGGLSNFTPTNLLGFACQFQKV